MLDEVSTLLNQFIKKWHFIRAAVPFDISILETADGKHRRVGVSWSGKTYLFIDPQKTKTLICWRLPYCSNVVDFILAVTLNSCKTVLRHTAQKMTLQFLRHSRLHSCWWMGVIFSRSWSFRILHLGYPPRFGVRRPSTSVCKSTGPQRGNQKQLKGGHYWDSSKIHCTIGNRLNAVRKQNGGAIQKFSANGRDWISISRSETYWTCWLGLFCTFRAPDTLLLISLSKQKRITSYFLILLSYDCFKNVISFRLNSIVEQYNIIAKLGTFLWATRYAVTGPQPNPPSNVSVWQTNDGLHIAWQPPTYTLVEVHEYLIEYKTVGQWVPLGEPHPAETTKYTWKTVSRNAVYNFRLLSKSSTGALSEPTRVVTITTTGTPATSLLSPVSKTYICDWFIYKKL